MYLSLCSALNLTLMAAHSEEIARDLPNSEDIRHYCKYPEDWSLTFLVGRPRAFTMHICARNKNSANEPNTAFSSGFLSKTPTNIDGPTTTGTNRKVCFCLETLRHNKDYWRCHLSFYELGTAPPESKTVTDRIRLASFVQSQFDLYSLIQLYCCLASFRNAAIYIYGGIQISVQVFRRHRTDRWLIPVLQIPHVLARSICRHVKSYSSIWRIACGQQPFLVL